MNKIRLIIAREYFTRVKKKSFVIMTILGPLLIVGMMMLIIFMGTTDDRTYNVAVYNKAGDYLPIELKHPQSITYDVKAPQMSMDEFMESKYNVYVDLHEGTIGNVTGEMQLPMVFKGKPPASRLKNDLSQQLEVSFWALRILKDSTLNIDSTVAGNTQKAQNILNHYAKVSFKEFDAEEDLEKAAQEESGYVGFILTFIIYIFIFLYGVQVMRGVIEEKTSRIVEVMISSVKPFQLMMGKIIGIAFVGLTQFAIWIILSVVLLAVISPHLPDLNPASMDGFGLSNDLLNDPTVLASRNVGEMNDMYILLFQKIQWGVLLTCFVFYFLFGYLLYGSLFAAVGSAVDSESDTQQFVLPISIPLIFGMYMGMTLLGAGNIESTTTTVLSHIPLTSPVIMPIRVATGTVGMGELLLSMAFLVMAFVFFTWIAGRIYRVGILMYGKKASYKELFKWMFYK